MHDLHVSLAFSVGLILVIIVMAWASGKVSIGRLLYWQFCREP